MRISERKERKATQTMGLMSTPATGGMRRRVGLRMGSVGHAAMFHGSTLRSYLMRARAGLGEARAGLGGAR